MGCACRWSENHAQQTGIVADETWTAPMSELEFSCALVSTLKAHLCLRRGTSPDVLGVFLRSPLNKLPFSYKKQKTR